MRHLLLTKKHSTKAERIFGERLKNLHIPFKVKHKVNGREIDFLVGRYAIDINGHLQDTSKNEMLAKEGYIPIHVSNNEVKTINLTFLQ